MYESYLQWKALKFSVDPQGYFDVMYFNMFLG